MKILLFIILLFTCSVALANKPIPAPSNTVKNSIRLYPNKRLAQEPQMQIEDVTPKAKSRTKHKLELILFGAKWCAPCRALYPMLGQLHNDEKLPVFYNDIDKFPKMAKQYGITAVPFWVLRVNGVAVESHQGGGINECAIRSWFEHANRVLEDKEKWLNTKQSGFVPITIKQPVSLKSTDNVRVLVIKPSTPPKSTTNVRVRGLSGGYYSAPQPTTQQSTYTRVGSCKNGSCRNKNTFSGGGFF